MTEEILRSSASRMQQMNQRVSMKKKLAGSISNQSNKSPKQSKKQLANRDKSEGSKRSAEDNHLYRHKVISDNFSVEQDTTDMDKKREIENGSKQ